MTETADQQQADMLGWAAVANVSKELVRRQRSGTKRPGTRHFVPGAKLTLLPAQWGDGWDKAYAVATVRRTGGRRLIRTILSTELLVNFRPKAIYDAGLWKRLTASRYDDDLIDDDDEAAGPYLWESYEQVARICASVRTAVTEDDHLTGGGRWTYPSTVHWEDQECDFCDGVTAERNGEKRESNPHINREAFRWTDPYMRAADQLWDTGWRTSQLAYAEAPDFANDVNDLQLRGAVALARNRLHDATWVAPRLVGLPVDEAAELARAVGLRLSPTLTGRRTNLLGRVTVELDENDTVMSARPG